MDDRSRFYSDILNVTLLVPILLWAILALNMKRTFLVLLVLACVFIGCGTEIPNVTLAAGDIFNPKIGDVWTFVDGFGHIMTITLEAAPSPAACRTGNNIIWHYRKNDASAYWLPGVPQAELQFLLHQNDDGVWRSTASLITLPQSCPWCNGATELNFQVLDNDSTMAPGYQIVPPTLSTGMKLVSETQAAAIAAGTFPLTFDCAIPAGQVAHPGEGEQWRTEFYVSNVHTPVYSGPAAVSEQWENCNAARNNPGCGHEKWWFAPGWGLVAVAQLSKQDGKGDDQDARLTMFRIR